MKAIPLRVAESLIRRPANSGAAEWGLEGVNGGASGLKGDGECLPVMPPEGSKGCAWR